MICRPSSTSRLLYPLFFPASLLARLILLFLRVINCHSDPETLLLPRKLPHITSFLSRQTRHHFLAPAPRSPLFTRLVHQSPAATCTDYLSRQSLFTSHSFHSQLQLSFLCCLLATRLTPCPGAVTRAASASIYPVILAGHTHPVESILPFSKRINLTQSLDDPVHLATTQPPTMRSPAQEKKPASARAAQKPKAGGGRPGPGPTFVSKLYKMLSDTGNARLITWTPAGDAFVVLRPSEFARKLLPTQYKHSQFQSFVRQANMYGFSKVTLPSALLTQLLAVGEPSTTSTVSARSSTVLVRTSTLVTDASPMPLPTSDASHAGPTSAQYLPHTEAAPVAAAALPAATSRGAGGVARSAGGKASVHDEQPWAFKHPKFMRGAVDLLPEVRRKARVRKMSLTGTDGTGGPPGGIEVTAPAAGNPMSPKQHGSDVRSGETEGESGAEDADERESPSRGGLYGEYDELDAEPSTAMSEGGGFYDSHRASLPAASNAHFSLHHSHVDRGTVFQQSASPRPHVETNVNDPLPPRPPLDPFATNQHPVAPYPGHAAPTTLPPPRSAPIADQHGGQRATSAAMFRLAELTSQLADMVTRSLPLEGSSSDDATSAAARNEVTRIVSEAWGIANTFTGADAGAESATESSTNSPRAARHHQLASWSHANPRLPYRPANRTYPGYPPAGHYYGSGPYARPPPYGVSARDVYLSPPYTSHPSFASRSPADMYWPDPGHFPLSPSHPPAHYNGSSPSAAAQYVHPLPSNAASAGGPAAIGPSHAPPLPLPLPASSRYHSTASAAAGGGPVSGLRYGASADMNWPEDRGADDERRRAPTAEEYEMAMAQQWH